jgi:hypothetical protein
MIAESFRTYWTNYLRQEKSFAIISRGAVVGGARGGDLRMRRMLTSCGAHASGIARKLKGGCAIILAQPPFRALAR